jgi:hypothetical protein
LNRKIKTVLDSASKPVLSAAERVRNDKGTV